ncbi:hypothetical protein ACIRBY_15790 [Streptomyces sp. NPDC096136]|uniref:hypothetical protein n=1 Tax=Streptomyces sp. NPDC096136 TaxID=3366076 RepID=UPI00382AAD86
MGTSVHLVALPALAVQELELEAKPGRAALLASLTRLRAPTTPPSRCPADL